MTREFNVNCLKLQNKIETIYLSEIFHKIHNDIRNFATAPLPHSA